MVLPAMSEVLLLRDAEVMEALAGPDAMLAAIEALEGSFRATARGQVSLATRHEFRYPADAGRNQADVSFATNWGISPLLHGIGGRLLALGPNSFDKHHGHWNMVLDFESLDLVCLMEDIGMHTYQVGANVGVATKYLARPDATVAAVLGSGRQARGSLQAMCAVRPIKEARVFSPNAEHRLTFAAEMSAELGIEVTAVDSARAAVSGAQVISCATTNWLRGGGAVFDDEALSPGVHINTIATDEVPEATWRRARIVPPGEAAIRWEPVGTLIKEGAIGEERLRPTLSQVVEGSATQVPDEDVSIFVGNLLGTHHLAMGRLVYERALACGIGTTWSL